MISSFLIYEALLVLPRPCYWRIPLLLELTAGFVRNRNINSSLMVSTLTFFFSSIPIFFNLLTLDIYWALELLHKKQHSLNYCLMRALGGSHRKLKDHVEKLLAESSSPLKYWSSERSTVEDRYLWFNMKTKHKEITNQTNEQRAEKVECRE